MKWLPSPLSVSFLLAYSSTHSHIYNVTSDGWNAFPMIPAGRRSVEAPSKTLPWTHHHQYAVLHSKANISDLGGEILMPGFMPSCFWSLVLCVCLSQQITDEGLVSLCRGCHKLQILCVSGCSNITDASLTAMGLNCPRLKWDAYTDTMTLIWFITHRICLAGMMTRCLFFFFNVTKLRFGFLLFFFFFYWLAEKHAWAISLTRAVHWLACGNKGLSRREIDPTCNLMYWGLWFSRCLLQFTWWYQPCLVTSLSVLHAVCSCAFSGSSKLHDALMSLMLGSLCWPGSVYGCFCSFV